MNSPPKEKPPEKNLDGLGKTVPGGSGRANDSASEASAQLPIPEYGRSRRRFLIYAVMCGFAPPARVVERVVGEIEAGK